MVDSRSATLEEENALLKERIAHLEHEIAFLRPHPVFLQGLKGETLVAKLTGGELTKFAEEYDVTLGENVTVEVKFSKLNTPVPGSSTRRWNWSKPLGWKDKGKNFDFLVLIGEKDARYPEQYLDNSPYVFFLVPKTRVKEIATKGESTGANVQITARLSGAKSPASLALRSCIVPESAISVLLESARAV